MEREVDAVTHSYKVRYPVDESGIRIRLLSFRSLDKFIVSIKLQFIQVYKSMTTLDRTGHNTFAQ